MKSSLYLISVLLWMPSYVHSQSSEDSASADSVDGGYSEWSQWSPCTKTCGKGTQTRTRGCTEPSPQGDGLGCEDQGLGLETESRQCNTFDCGKMCHTLMNLVIMVDSSRSVGPSKLETVREYLIHLLQEFDISEKAINMALVQYSTNARLEFGFDGYYSHDDLKRHIEGMKFVSGKTRTDHALQFVVNKLFNFASKGFREYAPSVVMVITDGITDQSPEDYYLVLQPYKDLGIDTIAVGVGELKDVNYAELNVVARGNSQNVFMMDAYDEIVEKLQGMAHTACHHPKPTTPQPTTKPAIVECHKALDLGILIDASASVTLKKLDGVVKEFLVDLVDSFPVSEHETHLGLIQFSSDAVLEFSFKDSYDSKEIKEKIINIEWILGATFTDKALHLAKEDLFSAKGGMRHGVPRALIVMTDGRSSRPKETLKSLIPLQGMGVTIFAYGVGHRIDEEELLTIALDKKEHVFRSPSYDSILTRLGSLAMEVCKDTHNPHV